MRKSSIVAVFAGLILSLTHCGLWQGEVADQEVSLEPVEFEARLGYLGHREVWD